MLLKPKRYHAEETETDDGWDVVMFGDGRSWVRVQSQARTLPEARARAALAVLSEKVGREFVDLGA